MLNVMVVRQRAVTCSPSHMSAIVADAKTVQSGLAVRAATLPSNAVVDKVREDGEPRLERAQISRKVRWDACCKSHCGRWHDVHGYRRLDGQPALCGVRDDPQTFDVRSWGLR